MGIFADRIKELREGEKWSQEDLANKLGLQRSSISSWETQRREPEFETLVKIARIFNVSVAYLIDEEAPLFPDHLMRKYAGKPLLTNVLIEVASLEEEDWVKVLKYIRKIKKGKTTGNM